MNVALSVVCLAFVVAEANHGAATSAKERPVSKVVRLLQDMMAELEQEKAEDKEVFDKLDCWCHTNEQEKQKAIDNGEAKMEDLKARLEEYAAKIEELKESLAQTKKKLRADQDALNKATAIRDQEAAAFNSEENELLDIVQSIKQALVVLSKHNPSMSQLKTVSKIFQALKNFPHSKDNLGRDKMAALDAFVQQAEYESEEQRSGVPVFKSYSSQSGQIVGILKAMQDDFETQLTNAQKQEERAKEEFAALKSAKQAELTAGKKRQAQLEQDDADFREKDASAYEELNDTREQLDIDKEFMYNLKKKCSATEEEFAARTKSRQEEILAVQDTIAILTEDEAFDAFDRTVNTAASFLQMGSAAAADSIWRRRAAEAVLRRAASPKLVLLAASVRNDALAKVKAAIDKMVQELSNQQQEEAEKREWCKNEIHENKRATAVKEDKKTDLQTSIEDMTLTVKKLGETIEAKKKEIVAMEAEMQKASEIREGENQDFQDTVRDQRLTQAILRKAIERMSQVYAFAQEEPGAPHTQLSGTKTDPGNGPARFNEYEQKKGGGRVIQMLEEVLADSKKLENEAINDEQQAHAGYESFMKDANKSIEQNKRSIVSMSEDKAKTEQALGVAKTDLQETLRQLEELYKVAGDLSDECDWLLRNFDARRQARATEIDALKEAKAILSGMK